MSDQFAPWITDPDDPADSPVATKSAADLVAAMFPDLVDKSNDGPLVAVEPGAPEVSNAQLVSVWNTAIGIIDRTEPRLRDLIERELAETAGLSGLRVGEAMQETAEIMKTIKPIRVKAIKDAFRYLRDQLNDMRIIGHSLAQWAATFAAADEHRIETAIRTGLLSGFENTEVARAVVGSQRLAGVDGVTEITRRQIASLARTTLKRRKDTS